MVLDSAEVGTQQVRTPGSGESRVLIQGPSPDWVGRTAVQEGWQGEQAFKRGGVHDRVI